MRLVRAAARWILGYAAPTVRCSACGHARTATRRLIAGPQAYLCDRCVAEAGARLAAAEADRPVGRCRFCAGERAVVRLGDAAPPVAVCAGCAARMADLLAGAPH